MAGRQEKPDTTLGSKAARNLRRQLNAGEFAAVEAFLADVRDGNDRWFFISALADLDGRKHPQVDDWVRRRPESVLARQVRARNYIGWAWDARGGGQAGTVTDEGWERFFKRLAVAEQDLGESLELDDRDPNTYAIMLITCKGLQLGLEEGLARFIRAKECGPEHLAAHYNYLVLACEKWGGSHEKMYGFAHSVRDDAPDGSNLHSIICDAHYERCLYGTHFDEDPTYEQFFRRPKVRRSIQDAYERSLGHPAHVKRRVQDFKVMNIFAWCFHEAGDYPMAKKLLRTVGDCWTRYPWYSAENYYEVRRELGLD